MTIHSLMLPVMMMALLMFEMSTDIYLSSLPDMGRFFQAPDAVVQMTISGYLLGFALMGLISGPLSDSRGRRPIILGTLGIFAGGSIWCWLAPTMAALIVARLTQGIGAGMSMVIIIAIIRDLFDDKNCSRILSTMGMVIALSPTIAPIVGGIMADIWGWKSCFLTIAVIAGILWVMVIFSLRESLPLHYRCRFSGRLLFQTYRHLFGRREIITFSLISAITYGGLWAWIVEAPFYMMNNLGIQSIDYGYYAAMGPAAYIVGTFLNRRCVVYYGVERLLLWGLGVMTLGAGLTLGAAIFYPLSIPALYIPFCLYASGLAPVFANAVTKAVAVEPSQRGAASALLSALEMGISAACALSVGFFSKGTLVPCTTLMVTSGVVCTILFFGNEKQTLLKIPSEA
jgi:DHA1 family bicyclomycin/chloramphenicol resistance-like MFS transporter